jgi:TatD DNase family protein
LQYVNIHTHFAGNEKSIAIINLLPQEESKSHNCFSCGIHPWYIQHNWEDQLHQLQAKILNNYCIAIGECGLDKLKGPDFEIQKNVFAAQIKLANEFNLPLIIHSVKSNQEVLLLLRQLNNRVKVIFHGFNNKLTTANQLINQGYFLSFGKALLKQNSNATNVLKSIPYEKFFLETDDDKNLSIEEIYFRASEILNIPLQKLKEDLFLRFNSLFIKA